MQPGRLKLKWAMESQEQKLLKPKLAAANDEFVKLETASVKFGSCG